MYYGSTDRTFDHEFFVLHLDMSLNDISARGTEGTLPTEVVLDLVMNSFDVGQQTWPERKPQFALASRKLLNIPVKRFHVQPQFLFSRCPAATFFASEILSAKAL